MSLLEVQPGNTVQIVGFNGDRNFESKLRPYGIFPGNKARVIRHAPLGGPFLVEVSGREVALGRGVAARIYVTEVPCASL